MKTLADRVIEDRARIPQLGAMARRKRSSEKWRMIVKVDLLRERARLDGDTQELPWSKIEVQK